mgnify:CR=1 FL=1
MKNTFSANFSSPKSQIIYTNIGVEEYFSLDIPFFSKPLIYLYGNLGMWKTTLSQILLRRCIWEDNSIFPSPTYSYYNVYKDGVYHFDLYRLQNYDEFIQIWGEEILLNRNGCIFVEWPELIEDFIYPDIKIHIQEWESQDTRNITLDFTPQYLS